MLKGILIIFDNLSKFYFNVNTNHLIINFHFNIHHIYICIYKDSLFSPSHFEKPSSISYMILWVGGFSLMLLGIFNNFSPFWKFSWESIHTFWGLHKLSQWRRKKLTWGQRSLQLLFGDTKFLKTFWKIFRKIFQNLSEKWFQIIHSVQRFFKWEFL